MYQAQLLSSPTAIKPTGLVPNRKSNQPEGVGALFMASIKAGGADGSNLFDCIVEMCEYLSVAREVSWFYHCLLRILREGLRVQNVLHCDGV